MLQLVYFSIPLKGVGNNSTIYNDPNRLGRELVVPKEGNLGVLVPIRAIFSNFGFGARLIPEPVFSRRARSGSFGTGLECEWGHAG